METTTVNGNMFYGPTATITVGASPFEWQNPEAVPIAMSISVGTVLNIEVANRDQSYTSSGILAGQFRMNPQDWIRVTYVLAPTMRYTPK